MFSYSKFYFFYYYSQIWYPFSLLVQVGDYKEGYYIGVEVAEDDPESHKPFYGPNKWPAPGKRLKVLAFEKKILIFT